jgi:hypothetical protein
MTLRWAVPRVLSYHASSAVHSTGTGSLTIEAKTSPPMTVMSVVVRESN